MLAAILVSTGLVRLIGALVFLELAARKRQDRHTLLFFGWGVYAIGPLVASAAGTETPIFGATAVAGTFLLITGALAYFREVPVVRTVLAVGALALGVGAATTAWPSAAPVSTIGAQAVLLLVAAAATVSARQEFVAVAPGSYIWLATLTMIGAAHALAFVTVYADYDLAVPYIATLVLSVAAMVFFLHMESEVSAMGLAKSEMRYRSVIEQAATGIAEVDLDGSIISCNRVMAESLGHRVRELEGRSFIHMVQESSQMAMSVQLDKIRNSDLEMASFEIPFVRSDGSTMWGSVSLSLGRDYQNRPSGYLAFVKDVSERKSMEEELARHRGDLEGLVSERTAALAEANRVLTELNRELGAANTELDQANSVKSEFLAKMSHELRTPLNSVIGFSGVLRQEMAGPLTEEQDKQLAFIHNSGTHLLELVNDILDLSKIEAQEMTPQIERFDLRKLMDELGHFIERAANEKGLELQRDFRCEECIIESDRRFIYQIMSNLAWNAVKFTHKGTIELSLDETETHVVLKVIDTGVGISAQDLGKVFEPFLQLSVDRTYNEPGSGLGLSISKQLARLLDGELEAESELGLGSTFTLRLPRNC